LQKPAALPGIEGSPVHRMGMPFQHLLQQHFHVLVTIVQNHSQLAAPQLIGAPQAVTPEVAHNTLKLGLGRLLKQRRIWQRQVQHVGKEAIFIDEHAHTRTEDIRDRSDRTIRGTLFQPLYRVQGKIHIQATIVEDAPFPRATNWGGFSKREPNGTKASQSTERMYGSTLRTNSTMSRFDHSSAGWSVRA
jgi:hypothetical protein